MQAKEVKMKLTLLFLAAFITTSYQYGYQKRWMSPILPHYNNYYPAAYPYYGNAFESRQQIQPAPVIVSYLKRISFNTFLPVYINECKKIAATTGRLLAS